jgi:hypothetical protein
MSDVSGIPYMGPMGTGNFFAPTFSYNPQMSAGQIQSAYMPEFYNNQNVVNNLFNTPGGGGGFGRATDYYSALGANYLAQVPSSWEIGGGGGGGASPYQTSPSVWDTGASPFLGGGGSSGLGGSIYDFSGGLGSLGASPYQTTPNVFDTGARGFQYPGAGAIDWGGLYQTAQSMPGMGAGRLSGLGGLGGAPYTPQPSQSSLNWGSLFGGGGGGGGARADPYPGMTMPGGLSSPMTMPQQPAIDPYPNMTMPGGLNAPMNFQQQQPVDFGSLFGQGVGGTAGGQPGGASVFDTGAAPLPGAMDTGTSGGGAGIGGLNTGSGLGQSYTQAAEPQRGMLQEPVTEAYNPYYGVTSPYSPRAGEQGAGAATDTRTSGALTPGGGLSAADLSAQARTRLAEVMRGAKEPSPDEIFAGDQPVPTEGRPAAAELPGEAGRAGMVGRPADPYEKLAETIPLPRARPEGADAPRPPASMPATETERRAYQEPPRPPANIPLSGPTLKGVNPRLVAAVEGGATFLPPGYRIELVSGREPRAFGYHPGGSAIDVRIIGPDGAIPHKGEDTTGMYTLLARGVKTWVQQNDPATASELGYGGAFGTRGGRPGEVPDLMHYDLGGSRGQMRPEVQFGRLQPLSEAEKNAMPAYIPLLGANQVPLDGRVPSGVGTRAPVAPMQFGGEFGGMGGELPSPGAFTPYPGWRQQSADFENRTAEQLGRNELAQLRTRGAEDITLPEVAPTPLGRALGLDVLGGVDDTADLPWSSSQPATPPRAITPEMQQRLDELVSAATKLQLPGEAGRGGYLNRPAEPPGNVVGPRSSAFGLQPGGFGEGGYGNVFTPNTPQLVGDTNLTPGDLTQRLLGDPFNPENYNTLDQAYDLAAARSPYVAQAARDPALMDTLKALAVAEVGRGRSNEQYAAFFESVLNQSAATNRNDLMAFLNSGYYQPINQGTMGPSYQYLRNNPEMSANIERMFGQAGAGSNVSNLAMENSSNNPDHPELGAGAMQPQYGGFLNYFLPGSNEYLTSKLNPFNDPRATRFNGGPMQELYRQYWQRMMPSGTEPWRGR